MTTPIAAGPLDRRVGDQSYVTEDGPLITGYDMGSPDGDYYCETHYDKETGVLTVLNFGRVLIPNVELTGAAPHGQQTKPQEIEK